VGVRSRTAGPAAIVAPAFVAVAGGGCSSALRRRLGSIAQVLGVASSARGPTSGPSGMPIRTATRGDGRPGWSGTALAAVDVRGDAVEVWRVQVGLDEFTRCALESEPLIERHQRPPTPGVVRPMLVTVGTGGSAAREARPVSSGVKPPGDCTAIAGLRPQPACGG
jgi:hypothetical protein